MKQVSVTSSATESIGLLFAILAFPITIPMGILFTIILLPLLSVFEIIGRYQSNLNRHLDATVKVVQQGLLNNEEVSAMRIKPYCKGLLRIRVEHIKNKKGHTMAKVSLRPVPLLPYTIQVTTGARVDKEGKPVPLNPLVDHEHSD